MTRIAIMAFGTRGDVVPLIGLAARLKQQLPAQVVIAAQQPYQQMIEEAGIEFALLPHDTERMTRESSYGQALVDGVRMYPSRKVLAQMRDDLAGVGEAMAAASANADLLLLQGPVGGLLGYHVAEALDTPSIGVSFQPASATGDFAPPAVFARSYGRWGNRMIWRLLSGAGDKVYEPLVAELRKNLGLPHESRRSYQQRRDKTWPILYPFSRHVVPRPADWRPGLDVTGYWWPPEPPEWQPPTELVDFLSEGPPPVFVGLGSTATAHGEKLSAMIAEALKKLGMRGVVQSGWARLHGIGESIFTVQDIPHSWLFPKMTAIVHHAGAGTSAAALRAGVPSVPVPGIVDQPFWGMQLHRIGAATAPIRRIDLTAESLTRAIADATGNPDYREHASRLSQLLATEDGEGVAMRIVAAHLRNPSRND